MPLYRRCTEPPPFAGAACMGKGRMQGSSTTTLRHHHPHDECLPVAGLGRPTPAAAGIPSRCQARPAAPQPPPLPRSHAGVPPRPPARAASCCSVLHGLGWPGVGWPSMAWPESPMTAPPHIILASMPVHPPVRPPARPSNPPVQTAEHKLSSDTALETFRHRAPPANTALSA